MRSRAPTRHRAGAFTLAELIVVLLVLAISAAIVLPQISGTAATAARSAAAMVSADLEYAQSMAIVTQSDVTVTFNRAGNFYRLTNSQSQPLVHPIDKKDFLVDFDVRDGFSQVRIAATTFAGDQVRFDALGEPTPAGYVTLTGGGLSYRVVVAAVTGRVTVVEAP